MKYLLPLLLVITACGLEIDGARRLNDNELAALDATIEIWVEYGEKYDEFNCGRNWIDRAEIAIVTPEEMGRACPSGITAAGGCYKLGADVPYILINAQALSNQGTFYWVLTHEFVHLLQACRGVSDPDHADPLWDANDSNSIRARLYWWAFDTYGQDPIPLNFREAQ